MHDRQLFSLGNRVVMLSGLCDEVSELGMEGSKGRAGPERGLSITTRKR